MCDDETVTSAQAKQFPWDYARFYLSDYGMRRLRVLDYSGVLLCINK